MSTPQDRDNPFAPPKASVLEAASNAAGELIADGQKLPAKRGVAWFGEAWDIFKRSPGMWVVIFIVFIILTLLLAIIPLGSLVSSIAYPAVTAGIMLGCRSLEEGGELELAHLFAGFKKNLGNLLIIGVLYLVGMMLIGMLAGIAAALTIPALAASGMRSNDFASMMVILPVLLLIILFVLAAMLPLFMAVWFAPAIAIFHDAAPTAAMRSSFVGSLKNFVPFLLYGIVGILLALLALVPFGLGMLVFGPLVWITMYTGYRDIFLRRA